MLHKYDKELNCNCDITENNICIIKYILIINSNNTNEL